MTKNVEEKIQQLQALEQSMHSFMIQKQGFQVQLMEIESALKELQNVNSAYKIVGNIMVKQPKEELEKDLNLKKETAELRIKALERQEEKIKEKATALQEEVLSEIKEKK